MAQRDGIKYWLSKQKFAHLYSTDNDIDTLLENYPHKLDLRELNLKASTVEESMKNKRLIARHKKKQYWEFRKFAIYMLKKHETERV